MGRHGDPERQAHREHPRGCRHAHRRPRTVPLNHAVLGGATFEDQITPNGTATAIFDDDTGQHNGLSYSGTYKVVFLAFPFEGYGNAAQQKELLSRAYTFFG